jgi:excisionase family DNA binding protein
MAGAGKRKVLSTKECAEYFRVHVSTIYRMLEHDQLPAFKIGSDWRFNVEDLETWQRERTVRVKWTPVRSRDKS